jgi:phospholipid transport system transporter-binding protein
MLDATSLPIESVTVANASVVLAQGVAAINGGQRIIDLSCIAAADSSAVAVLLAWKRAAAAAGATVAFTNMPANLQSLTVLYGVDSFLSEPQAASPADLHHH